MSSYARDECAGGPLLSIRVALVPAFHLVRREGAVDAGIVQPPDMCRLPAFALRRSGWRHVVMVRPPRFSEIYSSMLGLDVLQGGQCTGCHGSMGSYTVGATPNSAWQRLVNVPHNHGTACRNAGVPSLVVPNDKQRSLLYLKMAGLQPAACGDVMPRGTSAIPPSPPNQVVAIGTWIRLGAPND